jgi:hypothetical protein
MADAMIIDATVTGTAAMMGLSTEIAEIAITMEETEIAMDCGENSKILEVSS